MPPRRRGRGRGQILEDYAEVVDRAIDIEEGLQNRRSCVGPQVVQGNRPMVPRVQPSQSSQSSQPTQQQIAQQSGFHRFRPLGHQFKKKSGSSSSGLGSSSSSGPRAEFCGKCGGNHPTAQCVGVQGACNNCGQYGHFARLCPLAGSFGWISARYTNLRVVLFCLDWSICEDIQTGTVKGRLSWTGRRYLAGTSCSSPDQVQSTIAVIECETIASWIKELWQYSAMKKHPADKNQLGKIS
ncbi:hypothetical protein F511_25892 [Dorcoceras hygrometricum]|uniref:CCHC-type domain-containing protein n=1 Tax=Dorcoceras hygrometricum TaxID=472368 RepID=A0A2Z7D2R3_9LAMI|nr:hypothetical protein F511_25892 [Dorcoceras hygrometricum]